MALTISTGFVVDDAIVVIENITRYLEQGLPPMQSGAARAQEIGFTVLSISIRWWPFSSPFCSWAASSAALP